ncbi:hypothetical protein ACIQ9E_20060 [Streptomyces sp. NPDC094448]
MSNIRIIFYGTGHHNAPSAAAPDVMDTTTLHNPPDDAAVRAWLIR